MHQDEHSGRRNASGAVFWVVAIVMSVCVYRAAFVFATWERDNAPPRPAPTICITRPGADADDVLPNSAIVADIYLPNFGSGVSTSTMNTENVRLLKVVNGQEIPVPGHANTSGAGDSIVFQPTDRLEADTQYHFSVRNVKDTSNALFNPFDMKFRTAPKTALSDYPISFDHVVQHWTDGNVFTVLTVGPDHRLYCGTFDGRILRYDFESDGTVSKQPTVITGLIDGNKGTDSPTGSRLITGLGFDPKSTPENMILWVVNGMCAVEHCTDWSSKVSRLSGPNFSKYEDYVVGLPRAWRDHLSFKVTFGPDGALYFNQGSSSSTGSPDLKWGMRNEHLLTAACLRLDTDAVAKRLAAGQGPLNVKTEDDGHYNPFAAAAPLTFYATGIRCGFSMLWHSNGRLYCCVNGGAAGGAAPSTPDDLKDVPRRTDQLTAGPYNAGEIPGINYVTETQPDLFITIEKGAYYGHPNVTRGEYVMFGGNPDGGTGKYQVPDYPVGTKPDRNWHPATWCLGISYSCNGLIEYHGNIANGLLDHSILTTRYSAGKDVQILTPGPDGKIIQAVTGVDGLTGFVDPLDLVEDPATGNLYVSEFGGKTLTLLRPREVPSSGVFIERVNKVISGARVQSH